MMLPFRSQCNVCDACRYIYNSPIRLGRLMSLLQKDVSGHATHPARSKCGATACIINNALSHAILQIYDTERNRIIPYAVDLLVCGADEGGTFLYNIGAWGVRPRSACMPSIRNAVHLTACAGT